MKILLVTVVITLTACTSRPLPKINASASRTFEVNISDPNGIRSKEIDELDRKELETKLDEVLAFCQPILSGFESETELQSKRAFWLSMSGLLFGSVGVPALAASNAAANAAWISGLGGWAGATNFASEALQKSALSGSAIAERRNSIVIEIQSQIAIAIDGQKTASERRAALFRARSACVLYEIAVPTIPSREQPPNDGA